MRKCIKKRLFEVKWCEFLLIITIRPTFTLGVRTKKNLGPTLSIFLACCLAPKLLINARNFDVRILINNAETMVPRVANWSPKFDGILFFFSLGGQ